MSQFSQSEIGLITTLLSQNTQLYNSFNIDKFHMLKTSMLGNRSADVKAAVLCVVYFEAVKMLLSSFSDWENWDLYI